jgi:hypothetical protein
MRATTRLELWLFFYVVVYTARSGVVKNFASNAVEQSRPRSCWPDVLALGKVIKLNNGAPNLP